MKKITTLLALITTLAYSTTHAARLKPTSCDEEDIIYTSGVNPKTNRPDAEYTTVYLRCSFAKPNGGTMRVWDHVSFHDSYQTSFIETYGSTIKKTIQEIMRADCIDPNFSRSTTNDLTNITSGSMINYEAIKDSTFCSTYNNTGAAPSIAW